MEALHRLRVDQVVADHQGQLAGVALYVLGHFVQQFGSPGGQHQVHAFAGQRVCNAHANARAGAGEQATLAL